MMTSNNTAPDHMAKAESGLGGAHFADRVDVDLASILALARRIEAGRDQGREACTCRRLGRGLRPRRFPHGYGHQ